MKLEQSYSEIQTHSHVYIMSVRIMFLCLIFLYYRILCDMCSSEQLHIAAVFSALYYCVCVMSHKHTHINTHRGFYDKTKYADIVISCHLVLPKYYYQCKYRTYHILPTPPSSSSSSKITTAVTRSQEHIGLEQRWIDMCVMRCVYEIILYVYDTHIIYLYPELISPLCVECRSNMCVRASQNFHHFTHVYKILLKQEGGKQWKKINNIGWLASCDWMNKLLLFVVVLLKWLKNFVNYMWDGALLNLKTRILIFHYHFHFCYFMCTLVCVRW